VIILKLWKIIPVFLFLISFSNAITFDNYYNQKIATDYDYYFKTDLSLPADTSISTTQTNKVLSGNPSNLVSGSIVCPSTSLDIKPNIQIKFADNQLDVESIYPHPFGTFTTPLSCTASGRPTRTGKWLPTSTFNSQKSIGTSASATTDSSNYNVLAPFYDECVTYFDDATDLVYINRKGGVNVYCKGTYSIPGVSSGNLNDQKTAKYTIQSSKTFYVTGSGLDCFAALHKQPNTPDFRIYYYAYGFSGSISSGSKNIKVENRQNSISFGPTTPPSPVTIPNTTTPTLVGIPITNNGGAPIQITSVSSSNPLVVVEPFDNSLCSGLLPSSLAAVCSAGGSGFYTTINPGATRNVYVFLSAPTVSSPGSYSTTLSFTHVAQTNVCDSKTDTSSFTLNIAGGPGNPVRCEITPPTANVKQKQLYDFTVQCFDTTNAVVPCVGSNWNLVGLNGIIPVRSSSGATAGTHSSVGSTGQLVYTSGTFSCQSNLTVNASTETIDVQPPTANLKQNDTQPFTATCTQGGNATNCTGNQWDPYSTLIGQLSNSTISSTIYNATVNNITTQLYAVAFGLNPINPPYDWADITVGSGGNGNKTNGNGDEKKGKSKYCVIDPIKDTYYTGLREWKVTCLDPGNGQPISCKNTIQWYLDGVPQPNLGVQGTGTKILISQPGTTYNLIAYTDEAAGQKCELEFNSTSYDCVLYS
jgi:hypothetical protein